MELKYQKKHHWNHRQSVLIVPLWNWNSIAAYLDKRNNSVLIVPLWNWNNVQSTCWGSINCFNRTFMELKYSTRSSQWFYFIVLIVPLWNWNGHEKQQRQQEKQRFNRTFMELKWFRDNSRNTKKVSFNRTFMELKLGQLFSSDNSLPF